MMSIQITYPEIVEMVDGSIIEVTEDDWARRNLVVETDMPERAVRAAFAASGFRQNMTEYNKKGQIGRGMVKKIGDWQVHIRLYRHSGRIQIDGEVEVSSEYLEHLNHGWISGFAETMDIIQRHFETLWVYHKGRRQYVRHIMKETILDLTEPKSKTHVALLAIPLVLLVVGALLGARSRG